MTPTALYIHVIRCEYVLFLMVLCGKDRTERKFTPLSFTFSPFLFFCLLFNDLLCHLHSFHFLFLFFFACPAVLRDSSSKTCNGSLTCLFVLLSRVTLQCHSLYEGEEGSGSAAESERYALWSAMARETEMLQRELAQLSEDPQYKVRGRLNRSARGVLTIYAFL